jgi:hypothetical protein
MEHIIVDLHNVLRYLGVTVKGSTMMFGGDNESIMNSSSIPHACLHNKHHMALSFHHVHEGITAGTAKFHHIRTADNPADILNKLLEYP